MRAGLPSPRTRHGPGLSTAAETPPGPCRGVTRNSRPPAAGYTHRRRGRGGPCLAGRSTLPPCHRRGLGFTGIGPQLRDSAHARSFTRPRTLGPAMWNTPQIAQTGGLPIPTHRSLSQRLGRPLCRALHGGSFSFGVRSSQQPIHTQLHSKWYKITRDREQGHQERHRKNPADNARGTRKEERR